MDWIIFIAGILALIFGIIFCFLGYSGIQKKKEIEFIEEYRGNQIPDGKKSIVLRIKLPNDDGMLTSEQINSKVDSIVKSLNNRFGITIRQ